MPINYGELIEIAMRGRNLDVSAYSYNPAQLEEVAMHGKRHGYKLTVRDAERYSSADMVRIAMRSPGNVTFVIRE